MNNQVAMEWFAACSIYGLSLLAALLVRSDSRWGRAAAWPAGVGAMSAGLFLSQDAPLARFAAAVIGFTLMMRIVDLRIDARPWSVLERLWLCTAVVDTRALRPTRPRLDPRRLALIALHVGVAVLGWTIATAQIGSGDAALWCMRWFGGAILIYGIADVAGGVAVLAYEAGGFRVPPQHHAPILATSVGSFWSRHYNRNVSAWLGRHFHRPWAQRGHAGLGAMLAFGVSVAAHAWIAWVALDLLTASLMGGFFAVQGLLVVFERVLPGFPAWPIPARRIWTIGAMAITSPLFVEPFLRIVSV